MTKPTETGFLAIDVGNSRVKIGWYPPSAACVSEAQASLFPITKTGLSQPDDTLTVTHRGVADDAWAEEIRGWLAELPWQDACCLVASVYPEVLPTLRQVFGEQLQLLSHTDIPIEINVAEPDKVGIDRLLTALAACRLRKPGAMAITVGVGTAITVNEISSAGVFEGGAILPGIGMAASALQRETSALPHVAPSTLTQSPSPVGKSTTQAIQSGLYWGAVGAIRQLIEMFSADSDLSPQVFITDGDAQILVEQLEIQGIRTDYVPHMVLDGIVLVAEELS